MLQVFVVQHLGAGGAPVVTLTTLVLFAVSVFARDVIPQVVLLEQLAADLTRLQSLCAVISLLLRNVTCSGEIKTESFTKGFVMFE